MSEFDDDMLDDSIDDDLAITDEDDDGDDWKDTNSWTEEGSAEDKVKLKILYGSMTDISEQQKNVIRLFISSTFTGMLHVWLFSNVSLDIHRRCHLQWQLDGIVEEILTVKFETPSNCVISRLYFILML